MARDLRSKKMPSKPMRQVEADEELELDMPMSDEELGEEEALDEELMMDEEEMSPLESFSDDELLMEVQKRGLALEEMSEAEETDEAALAEEESY